MQKKAKIIVVDDEEIMRDSLRDWLVDVGHEVWTAENGDQALEIIRKENPGVAVIDLILPGTDGIDLLKKARRISPNMQVIIITAYGSVPTAIAAIKEGAYDYIEKPFLPGKVELIIDKLAERQALLEENISLRKNWKKDIPLRALWLKALGCKK
jgi:two-component system C4-dicarboxylate transport response regulator DctD